MERPGRAQRPQRAAKQTANERLAQYKRKAADDDDTEQEDDGSDKKVRVAPAARARRKAPAVLNQQPGERDAGTPSALACVPDADGKGTHEAPGQAFVDDSSFPDPIPRRVRPHRLGQLCVPAWRRRAASQRFAELRGRHDSCESLLLGGRGPDCGVRL